MRFSRRVFMCSGAAAGLAYGAQGFWNKKDPGSWTSDEVLQLMTRSPWAVQARVLPKPGRDKGSSQAVEPEVGGGRGGGRGTGPEPVVSVTEVTVVWASARPLLETLKTSFPNDFANHYVLSISDLPPGPGGKPVAQEDMEAKLETKGKQSVGAGGIEITRDAARFAFSRELLPLTLADKEVRFVLETSMFSITARFDLKDMLYRGALTL